MNFTGTESKVKIVCTMGPSCQDFPTVESLVYAGMNAARFNFSHGTYESHANALCVVRRAEEKCGVPIAVVLDTKGIEIRTGKNKDGLKLKLEQGNDVFLSLRECKGTEKAIYVDYPLLFKEIPKGQDIFIDDGKIHLKAISLSEDGIMCQIVSGGELGECKGINVPGAEISASSPTKQDISDIKWGVEHRIDYLAQSFVRSAGDVKRVRSLLTGFSSSVKIIAKIETRQAVANIDSIITAADGIMIARGDLGVEIPIEDVPIVQKSIIKKCNALGKPVIVATQMLDSMIRNPRPTRAESNDVANAVLDGSDAVMLSGETAVGRYPVEAVSVMKKLVLRAEEYVTCSATGVRVQNRRATTDAVSRAAAEIANMLNASAVLSLTRSGATARMVSKYRPNCPIVAVTPSREVWRGLTLVWGVYPILSEFTKDVYGSFVNAVRSALKLGYIKRGDTAVITSGIPFGVPGSTNFIQVYTVRGPAGADL